MQHLIDQVGAVIIAGVIVFAISTANISMADFSWDILYTSVIQSEAQEISKILEYDFDKIGYNISGEIITIADSNEIKFNTDFTSSSYPEGDGTADVLKYSIGSTTEMERTSNPNDFPLYRDQNADNEMFFARVIRFNLSYYDSLGCQLSYTSLALASERKKIKSIKIICNYESAEMIDSIYSYFQWEKEFNPKSLTKLN